MSQLTMSETEQQEIDAQVEIGMLGWAKNNTYEAEQLAMDASRLLSCTSDRFEMLSNQGFFKRCWSRFSGAAASADRANVADLAQMQKISLRYINMLQEKEIMMAHSMLAMKNHLLSLTIKEKETRELIVLLAEKTKERFDRLEHRVEQLEISSNLHAWLLGLKERDYQERIPTKYMRLFKVIGDFYRIKNDKWDYNDLMLISSAIRAVGINPKEKISLKIFINELIDEMRSKSVGIVNYNNMVIINNNLYEYSKYAIENISSPVFITIHRISDTYEDRCKVISTLNKRLNATEEALKELLYEDINELSVNMDYEFTLAETAIEILGCLRLVEHLSSNIASNTSPIFTNKNEKFAATKHTGQGEKLYCQKCGTACENDDVFCHNCGSKNFKYAN